MRRGVSCLNRVRGERDVRGRVGPGVVGGHGTVQVSVTDEKLPAVGTAVVLVEEFLGRSERREL